MFTCRGKLTLDLIKKYIELFKAQELPRLKKLERYYKAKNDTIVNRTFEDISKPNNKLAHAYAAYITDTLSAYMVGKPVSYSAQDDTLNTEIADIMNYNDSADNDLSIAESQSIYGRAYELMYVDEDGHTRFKCLNTLESIAVYDGTVENNLKYFIRYCEEQDPVTLVTTVTAWVYDDVGCSEYRGSSVGDLTLIDTVENVFGYIQINEYINNNFLEGDFEKVISLIDAYDLMCSDTLNELDYFSDAYLLFANCEIDTDSVQDMKNNRIIQATSGDSGQAAVVQWLTKNADDVQCENTKKRTVDEIHKLSKVPNLDPSAFVSHTTASHVFYSLLATEDLVSKKEKKFKKGLQQRLEKIVHLLNVKGIDTNYDYRDIEITFNRNIPQGLESIADPISKLRDLISDETLISLIPGITNPIEELKKRDAQREKERELMNTYRMLGDDLEN
ncbi:phage portal protein [Cellulosilyticum sp. WCF-2]|uniref:phage portal protein n=1 Tax=Cellulosilyticum sp. WCF-2 TaxID=2497860 RepID=UPI000F8C7785|nr:phage portal protein [Cellulosilyticum sp. WCF-2]QEH68211.1 phage portal protein [Cellulosilyticum sp. WCF-2]